MRAFLKLAILALCASLIYTEQQQPRDSSEEYAQIAKSLKDYDEQDGDFLRETNKQRGRLQLSRVEYDAGLLKLANKISFDMAQSDSLFRPDIVKSDKMSIIGSAVKIPSDISKNTRIFLSSSGVPNIFHITVHFRKNNNPEEQIFFKTF